MGFVFGKSKSKSKSTKDTEGKKGPWEAQEPYLKSAFEAAQGAFDEGVSNPFYEGPLHSGLNDMQKMAADRMYADAEGKTLDLGQSLQGIGKQVAGTLSGVQDSIGNIVNGARDLFNPKNIAASGEALANGAQADGLVDAASRDVVRQLQEGDLVTNDNAAAATGNTNSSRAGTAEAILTRGAADRIGDISSQIRGSLFSKGIDVASDLARGLTGSQLTGTGQLLAGANQGLSTAVAGSSLASGAFKDMLGAGGMYQDDAQSQMLADYARWQGQDSRTFDLLDRYYGIVGSNNWGSAYEEHSKGTGKTTSTNMGVSIG